MIHYCPETLSLFSRNHPFLIFLLLFPRFPSWSSIYLFNISPIHGFIFSLLPWTHFSYLCFRFQTFQLGYLMDIRDSTKLNILPKSLPLLCLIFQLVLPQSAQSPKFTTLERYCHFDGHKSYVAI